MTNRSLFTSADTASSWRSRPGHRRWLERQADRLIDFFAPRFVNPAGGFFDLDAAGRPLDPAGQVRGIHMAARAAHCFTIAAHLGRPGAGAIVDHAIEDLWLRHRDAEHGGYFWSLDRNGPVDTTKQGYGHAFVLLAASSALTIGHPLASRLLADVTDVIESRFWDDSAGAIREEFAADWSPLDGGRYRGQNSNMHLTEALMAAFEATGETAYLTKAKRIADLIIRRIAGSIGWRVAEHFDTGWTIDKAYYHPNEMFRPAGTTPGHWLEWARLILQLWVLGGRKQGWMPEAAEGLFAAAMRLGWDKVHGGFFYTLDWDDKPQKRQKLWWPLAEGAAAAHFLCEHRPGPAHEAAYRQIWDVIARHIVDTEHGGWREELTEAMQPANSLFPGKGDLYHALQACLIPLYPATGSLTRVIPETTGG